MQQLINHIALVLDASSSMKPHEKKVVEVADEQIRYLAEKSQQMDQETRVTVYTFADTTQWVCYDKDVLRLPSLKGQYVPVGMTALIDATLKAIQDLKQTATLYGDHAFLVYVLTDGEENRSKNTRRALDQEFASLQDNWTVSTFVPNANGEREALRLGFPAGNIMIWSAHSSHGMDHVANVIRTTTDTFMANRASGIRGTKNLFTPDMSNMPSKILSMTGLPKSSYRMYPVLQDAPIRDYIERVTGRPYRMGQAYYELTKLETVQDGKNILVEERKSGDVFGGKDARSILGIPPGRVRIEPGYHPDWRLWRVFVQSTSVNRKLIAGTKVLVMQ